MKRKMSIFGVGPSIMASAGAYAAITGLATLIWPEFCLVQSVSHTAFLVAGTVLIFLGIPFLVAAVRAMSLAYHSDKLATTGLFGLTRNPIYCAWIVFIIPGLVLLSRSWPMFLAPLVAYLVFKARIGRENEYLKERFGEEYRKYKTQVHELLPFPRRK
jgi:protein-S-isoprenylcysteine O-methyltransferase Ste14